MTRTHSPLQIQISPTEYLRGSLSFTNQVGVSAVVYVHGLGGHRGGEKSASLQTECERRNWTFLACDFRGHGESSGTTRELTGSRLIADLTAIQSYLQETGVERLFLVGSSMGGWASAWFTHLAGNLVQRCVLLAPALQFLYRRWDQLPTEEMSRFRDIGVYRLQNEWIDIEFGYELLRDRERFPPEALIRSWSHPALIFHGLQDDVVPYQDSVEFISGANPGLVELRLLKNGDHRLSQSKHEIALEACRWFEPDWR